VILLFCHDDYECPFCHFRLRLLHGRWEGKDFYTCKCEGEDSRFPELIWWHFVEIKEWRKWGKDENKEWQWLHPEQQPKEIEHFVLS
jgi:hypothetical protein